MAWSDIQGYSDFLPIYREAVDHFGNGAVFAEVGVALGHSLAYLARCVIDAGHKDTRIYGVDPWAGTERNGEQQDMLAGRSDGDFGIFLDQMRKFAPEELERILVVRLPSLSAYKSIGSIEVFDMVLLDGDHSANAVEMECRSWPNAMREGSWLCGDDYRDIYKGVIDGVHRVFPKDRVEVLGKQGWSWRVRL